MMRKQDGSVWIAGWNGGNDNMDQHWETDRNTFVQVVSSGAQAISAGEEHSMILKRDGSVWAKGSNHCGQLGDGSGTWDGSRTNFKQVAILA